MSKKEKEDSPKSKLAKLKKVIKKLTKFENVLKAKEKKIDKKLKLSDKLKKSKIKKLMEKFEESEKNSKKVSKKIKAKKAEAKKIKKNKKETKGRDKKFLENIETVENDLIFSSETEQENPEESNISNSQRKDDSISRSINFNSKDAIAFLRSLNEVADVDDFIKKDNRITVKSAAKSRKNALLKK